MSEKRWLEIATAEYDDRFKEEWVSWMKVRSDEFDHLLTEVLRLKGKLRTTCKALVATVERADAEVERLTRANELLRSKLAGHVALLDEDGERDLLRQARNAWRDCDAVCAPMSVAPGLHALLGDSMDGFDPVAYLAGRPANPDGCNHHGPGEHCGTYLLHGSCPHTRGEGS